MPIFNSCTKRVGTPGRIHDAHRISWARMSSYLNVALIPAMLVIDVLGLFLWGVIHGRLYNQALADVLSTRTGIKCLYCTCSFFYMILAFSYFVHGVTKYTQYVSVLCTVQPVTTQLHLCDEVLRRQELCIQCFSFFVTIVVSMYIILRVCTRQLIITYDCVIRAYKQVEWNMY